MDKNKVAEELLKLAKEIESKESAADVYKKNMKELQDLLKKFTKKLRTHQMDFEQDGSSDWGYPGDLGHYVEVMEGLVNPR